MHLEDQAPAACSAPLPRPVLALSTLVFSVPVAGEEAPMTSPHHRATGRRAGLPRGRLALVLCECALGSSGGRGKAGAGLPATAQGAEQPQGEEGEESDS